MDCSVCQHPGKPEIERLLASGAPLRKVAAQFNLGRMALLRHKQNHMACHGSTVTNDRDKNGNRDNIDLYRYAKSKNLPEWDCYALWFWGNAYRDNPESERGRFAKEKILVPLLKKHPFLEEMITLEG